MAREDLEKLLGGYATNTLTDQERKDLFEAALSDQALFDALIDEQAMKEVLDEPRSRRLLIAALRDRQARAPGRERLQAWVRSWEGRLGLSGWRPTTWALAGSVVVALLAVTFAVRFSGPLPDTSMRTASKVPADPTAPVMTRDSKTDRESSDINTTQAPASNSIEPRIGQPLTRDPSSRSPGPRDENASMPGDRDFPLSSVSPPVADERQTASPPVPAAKQEQELRSTAKGAIPPAPHVAESFSRQGELQTEHQDTAQGTLPATGLEQKALSGAREQMRPLSPMAAATPRSKDKNPVPGVRYSILQEEKDGTYSEVNAATTFGNNDKARVAIEPNESGYLYVLKQDATGNSRLVFPPEVTGATAKVEKTVRYLVPPSGAFSFEEPGDIRLMIILTPERLEDAQSLQNLPGLLMAPRKHKTERRQGITGEESADALGKSTAPAPSRLESGPNISKQELILKHH